MHIKRTNEQTKKEEQKRMKQRSEHGLFELHFVADLRQDLSQHRRPRSEWCWEFESTGVPKRCDGIRWVSVHLMHIQQMQSQQFASERMTITMRRKSHRNNQLR